MYAYTEFTGLTKALVIIKHLSSVVKLFWTLDWERQNAKINILEWKDGQIQQYNKIKAFQTYMKKTSTCMIVALIALLHHISNIVFVLSQIKIVRILPEKYELQH